MNRRLSLRRCLTSILSTGPLALALAACAIDPTGGTAAASAGPTEAEKVQAYLDSLYLPSSVVHSFTTATGVDIDCALFSEEPGVKALLASGMTMDEVTSPLAAGISAEPARSRDHFEGGKDDHGRERSCPAASVPHVRLTAATIAAAGGLDAYRKLFEHKQPAARIAAPHTEGTIHPDAGGYQEDTGNYAWVQNVFSDACTLSAQGGTSTMTIAAPSIAQGDIGSHSVAQIWLTGADHPGEVRQTIEAGWEAQYIGTGGVQTPRLFVGTTANGYGTWCDNGVTASTCPVWVPNPGATLALNQPLTPSVAGGVQHELTFVVRHLSYVCSVFAPSCGYSGWAVYAGVDTTNLTYLGYYANGGYGAQGSVGLATSADDFENGGEVYDGLGLFGSPPAVTMGEGAMLFGMAAYGSTAYHRNYGYYNASGNLVLGPSEVHYTNSDYTYNITAAAGAATWTNYFYYGDWRALLISGL